MVARFSGKRWDIPSRIYSDSLTVYTGQSLKDLGFFERLARLNYHPVIPGRKVAARGEYSYDAKAGKFELFLHSFAYPDHNFPGELVEMRARCGGPDHHLDTRPALAPAALLDRAGARADQRHLPGQLGAAPAGETRANSAALHRRDPRRRRPSLLRASRHRPGADRQGGDGWTSPRAISGRAVRRSRSN